MSFRALARATGQTVGTVHNLVRGRTARPSAELLTVVSAALGLTLQQVLSDQTPSELEAVFAGIRSLSPKNQRAIAVAVRALVESEKAD